MDASQYKDYVLTLLFVKYVSDKYGNKKDSLIEVPEGASFDDMIALKGKSDIGEQINKKILKPLFAANGLEGSMELVDFDDDDKLGSGKEKIDLLTNLISIFENPGLNFKNNRAEDDDILGDAYEFLMRHFAQDSGKSKGQFYTPSEVSRILAKVISVDKADKPSYTVYDPTCGSASLLLKVVDESKWGTCNIEEKRIWLNLELSKKPIICLEYIIVHELVHLLERNHNEKFVSYINQFMPKWRIHRDELNNLPVAHNDWGY